MLKALFEHWPSAKSPEPPKQEGKTVIYIFFPLSHLFLLL